MHNVIYGPKFCGYNNGENYFTYVERNYLVGLNNIAQMSRDEEILDCCAKNVVTWAYKMNKIDNSLFSQVLDQANFKHKSMYLTKLMKHCFFRLLDCINDKDTQTYYYFNKSLTLESIKALGTNREKMMDLESEEAFRYIDKILALTE